MLQNINSLRRGFSLIELAMVLAISGLMLSFTLQANQSSATQDCYEATKIQINVIRNAVESFARSNDRLPLPAARNIGVDNILYGRESSGANIDEPGVAGTTKVSFGAVPFQALGLSPSFAGDCWGNKFTYAVTTALTTSASSGGYLDATMLGNIALKSALATTLNSTIAYAIISHGEDQLGGVKINYAAANGANTPPYVGHSWCSGAATIAYTNCLATAATVMNAPFNNGKDAGASYFDDIVVASGKPQILSTGVAYGPYCWGDNTYGQLGDGTTTERHEPTPVDMPDGVAFTQMAVSLYHSCALDSTGAAWCWGYNGQYVFGNGTNTNSHTPTAVTMPVGVTFTHIVVGEVNTCALTAAGVAYCWGFNSESGVGWTPTYGWGSITEPTAVSGGHVFQSITLGINDCGVTVAGDLYCWGYYMSSGTPIVLPGSGGHTWASVVGDITHNCALTTGGDAYCWGYHHYGQLGDGPASTTIWTPVAVSGGHKFAKISVASVTTCAITSSADAGGAGKLYCWGGLAYANYDAPHLMGSDFIDLSIASVSVCGVKSDYTTECIGVNADGQLGDGTTTTRSSLTSISGDGTWPIVFSDLAVSGYDPHHRCALQPPRAVAWGLNVCGSIGDDTTDWRQTPVYITLPAGVNAFTALSSGYGNSCGIGNNGEAYCWGNNDGCGWGGIGMVGDGTHIERHVPTLVTRPGGVDYWKKIQSTTYWNCAIGSDDKPYCWGNGASYGDIPHLVTLPCTTATGLAYGYNDPQFLGTDGNIYPLPWYSLAASALTLPVGAAPLKKHANGTNQTCIIGNNNQLYCNGHSDGFDAIGDGSTSVAHSTTFYQVTNPGGVMGWKEVSVGDIGGGYAFACGIGDDDQIYCWGYCYGWQCGNDGINNYTTQYIPTPINSPAGVTGWSDLNVGRSIVTAKGKNNGKFYYFGTFWTSDMWAPGFLSSGHPAEIPLPATDAAGYTGVGFGMEGRMGFVR